MSLSAILDPNGKNDPQKKMYVYSVGVATDVDVDGAVNTVDLNVSNNTVLNNVQINGPVTFPGLNANSLLSTDGAGGVVTTISSTSPSFSTVSLTALSNQVVMGATGNITLSAAAGPLPYTAQLSYPGFSGVTNLLYSDFSGTSPQQISSGSLQVASGDLFANSLGLDDSSNQVVFGSVVGKQTTLSAPDPAADQVLTFPDSGQAAANLLVSEFAGTQLISSGSLSVAAGDVLAQRIFATNAASQVVLGVPGNQTVVSAAAPAAPQTVTIPDSGQPAANFVLSELAQTINGVKTFTSRIVQPEMWTQRFNSAAQSIPDNVLTDVLFTSSDGSTGFAAPIGDSVFKVPVDGRYNISYTIQFAASAVGQREGTININAGGGGFLGKQRVDACAAGTTCVSGSFTALVGIADGLTISVLQNSGGALNINNVDLAYVSISYIGPP